MRTRSSTEPVPRSAIVEARDRVVGVVRRTPVLWSGAGSFGVDISLALKLELLQHGGSFKVRGAFNNALSGEPARAGLIAASGGNHGLAVAYVAHALGIPAEIFIPAVTPAVKRDRIAALGATVVVAGDLYDDAQEACNQRAAESEARLVHPYDTVATVAGQATLGLELAEQVPDLDTVLVAVGGGGLAAGVAAALDPSVRIVVVEPESSCCFAAAVEANRPVDVDVSGVAADSLGARRIGDLAWALLGGRAESVVVTDEAIVEARRRLWQEARMVVEPGGATALAALVSDRYRHRPDERVAVIACGANTDPADLGR